MSQEAGIGLIELIVFQRRYRDWSTLKIVFRISFLRACCILYFTKFCVRNIKLKLKTQNRKSAWLHNANSIFTVDNCHLVKKLSVFMEVKGALPRLQEHPMGPILSQIHKSTSHLSPFGFPTKILYAFLLFSLRAIYPVQIQCKTQLSSMF